jgi:hypothetical protein
LEGGAASSEGKVPSSEGEVSCLEGGAASAEGKGRIQFGSDRHILERLQSYVFLSNTHSCLPTEMKLLLTVFLKLNLSRAFQSACPFLP